MNEFARFSVHQGAAQRQPGPYSFDLGSDDVGGAGGKPMSDQRILELLKRYFAMNSGEDDSGSMPVMQVAPIQSQATPIQWGEEGGKGGGGGFLSNLMGMFGGGRS